MLSFSEFEENYKNVKSGSFSTNTTNMIKEYFLAKFPESKQIFEKLNDEYIISFIQISELITYKESELVLSKDEKCDSYYFIIYGDINFYETEFKKEEKNVLIKTVSEGNLYGHKIREKFKFFAYARGELNLLKVEKNKFDEIIENANKSNQSFKLNFIKKFFPQIRLYSDDVIENILQFFTRVEYPQFSKIIVDGNYDEFIYLIIKGEIGIVKRVNRIIPNKDETNPYLILEKLTRGEIFGAYSAIKENKSNVTAMALKSSEIYKISKGHLLFYFGGHNGFIPKTITAIDDLLQKSLNLKLAYLVQNEECIDRLNLKLSVPSTNLLPIEINENKIENTLKDAWKDLENLDIKLTAFKTALLTGKTNAKKPMDIFAKIQETNNENDLTKLSGAATNRIVARKLNAFDSAKKASAAKLSFLCGIKKENREELKKLAEISNKMEGKKGNRLLNFSSDDINSNNEINHKEDDKKPKKRSLKDLLD